MKTCFIYRGFSYFFHFYKKNLFFIAEKNSRWYTFFKSGIYNIPMDQKKEEEK